jgi:integrase
MKGSIRERNGALQIRISLGKDSQTGEYSQHTETVDVSGLNRKEAKDKADKRLRALLTDIDKGVFVRPGKSTVAEYLKAWLADYVKPNLAANTYALYSIICDKHIIPAFGNLALVDLKPTHLQHLYAEKQNAGLSNRTVQLIHVTLHKSLKNAVKAGLLSRNVAEAVDTPKIQRREMRTMNETDVHIFLEMARNTEYYGLFYTLLFTGMRRGEALALRWSDIDLLLCQLSITRSLQQLRDAEPGNRLTFKQPKTQKSRRLIALSPSTAAVLREHREAQIKQRQALELPALTDSDLVFSHWNGSPLLPSSITAAWIKLTRRCGLSGIRLHDARHTHASLMLKQGVSPKVISERLGHASIAITLDLYAHTTKGMQEEAAAKFDDIVLPKVK